MRSGGKQPKQSGRRACRRQRRTGPAQISATPPQVLAVLASDTDVDVRKAVAENGAVPLELLLVLASDGDAGVREAAAANPNATDEVRAAGALTGG
jgi:hypothetical protein